jgi:hypothetical protein
MTYFIFLYHRARKRLYEELKNCHISMAFERFDRCFRLMVKKGLKG